MPTMDEVAYVSKMKRKQEIQSSKPWHYEPAKKQKVVKKENESEIVIYCVPLFLDG
ncbi:hypothetical protein GOV14_05600 [Candidatus Pacearchaeota archaeon]|nr:hypothetical protein [Candidatus Pacearchaeota archaeon]